MPGCETTNYGKMALKLSKVKFSKKNYTFSNLKQTNKKNVKIVENSQKFLIKNN